MFSRLVPRCTSTLSRCKQSSGLLRRMNTNSESRLSQSEEIKQLTQEVNKLNQIIKLRQINKLKQDIKQYYKLWFQIGFVFSLPMIIGVFRGLLIE